MGIWPLQNASTVHRSGVSSADSTSESTFRSNVSAVKVYGANEIWLWAQFSAASQSATVALYFYDENDNFIADDTEQTLTADATRNANGKYLAPLKVRPCPGAHGARVHVVTPPTSGTVDIYLGYREGST